MVEDDAVLLRQIQTELDSARAEGRVSTAVILLNKSRLALLRTHEELRLVAEKAEDLTLFINDRRGQPVEIIRPTFPKQVAND